MSSELLNDDKYVSQMEICLDKALIDSDVIVDKSVAGEYVKMIIKKETIHYSVVRKKLSQEYEKFLKKRLCEVEELLCIKDDNIHDLISEYKDLKYDHEMLQAEKTKGCMIRSKAVWIEEGEHSSKYFLNLQRHNQEIKNIVMLKTDVEENVTDPDLILERLHEFYVNLYEGSSVNNNDVQMMFQPNMKIEDMDKDYLDKVITQDEYKEALDMIPSCKTPGSDGLTTEFLRKFGHKLANLFYESLNYSVKCGELSCEQR